VLTELFELLSAIVASAISTSPSPFKSEFTYPETELEISLSIKERSVRSMASSLLTSPEKIQ